MNEWIVGNQGEPERLGDDEYYLVASVTTDEYIYVETIKRAESLCAMLNKMAEKENPMTCPTCCVSMFTVIRAAPVVLAEWCENCGTLVLWGAGDARPHVKQPHHKLDEMIAKEKETP